MQAPRTENTIFRIDISVDHLVGLARELRPGTCLNVTPENREELAKKLWDSVYDLVWEFIEDNLED